MDFDQVAVNGVNSNNYSAVPGNVHQSCDESDFRLIVHIRYIINCDEGERILMVDEIH